jgi:hypothetical protein
MGLAHIAQRLHFEFQQVLSEYESGLVLAFGVDLSLL